jgi:hypothetical protein
MISPDFPQRRGIILISVLSKIRDPRHDPVNHVAYPHPDGIVQQVVHIEHPTSENILHEFNGQRAAKSGEHGPEKGACALAVKLQNVSVK